MKKSSLKINAIMNAILTLSSVIFPLFTFPYASRILLPSGMGKVSLAISFISYFSMFAQLGIPTYGIRACAKVRDNKDELTHMAQELLIINIVASIVSYLVLGICFVFIEKIREEKLLYIIISSSIILSSIGMEWLYKALEQYRYITIRSLFFKLISLGLLFLLVRNESDYVMYGLITIFASSASYVLNLINAHKYISFRPVGNYNFGRHLKAVFVFFAMACATTIYTHLDTVMVGFIKTNADVGYYSAAVKVKTILVHVVTSLGAVLLPRSSYYIQQRKFNEFKKITHKAVNFVFIIAVPLSVYFVMFAENTVLLLSGESYLPSVIPMQIIMPTLLVIGLSNILGMQMLVPLGKEKIVLHSEIAGAIVDLILNIILIPQFASSGAAIGTLAAEIVVLLYQYRVMRIEIKDAFCDVHYIKIIFALLLSVSISFCIKLLDFGDFMTLFTSAILFFSVYFGILIFMKERLIIELMNQLSGKIIGKLRNDNQRKDK